METTQLAQLKLESFKLAMQLASKDYFSTEQGNTKTYSVSDLIKDAETIYQSITNNQ